MPNLAATIKAEISRLAKKEAKAATTDLKRASVRYRAEIAKLKRHVGHQEREIKLLKKQVGQHGQEKPTENELEGVRFSARSVKAQRQRLGLSAANYGKLVGVSGLTIYAWEQGKSQPRKAQLAALVAVRGIGKREAWKKLAEMTAKRKGKRW
jgi:DNA-binding transcriptional regulator YiaG